MYILTLTVEEDSALREWEIKRDIRASRTLSPDRSFVGSVTSSEHYCLGRPGLKQQM